MCNSHDGIVNPEVSSDEKPITCEDLLDFEEGQSRMIEVKKWIIEDSTEDDD
ncbi:TPA: hypothetical protein NGU80_004752 [Vibrio parahaemolyticus]|uniref:hypothetical protein n=1 Tax=Vibrio harveyi group TaxID=717610 RepID=UPI0015DEF923|nr:MULTISPECIES: hypothetical protein [Vibrio harveyi group]ELB1485195.1 hypothetical protein [Vibrio parahaemolyticus]MBM4928339.1 hypothetical protein [Vibrio parahaemolyticus]MBS9880940.1 hypothetical protein [Vibrio alginolyticus]HCE4735546.1 hypothetical protein [Vibrio parahaemolyticus]HCG9872200.1 hypothetical protein [Vibrio parahaemolyticus]